MDDRVARARMVLGATRFLTLATADAQGRPWACTVWYAAWQRTTPVDRLDLELLWLSHPEAQHSRHLSERPEVGVSVFDSNQPAGAGVGVQLLARAERVPSAEVDESVAVLSAASVAAGGTAWDREEVETATSLRLYRARPRTAYVLGAGTRLEVPLCPRMD